METNSPQPMRRAIAAASLVLLIAGPAADAQVRYKDADGVTHWVDSIDLVPPEYRQQAVDAPARAGRSAAPPVDGEQKPTEAVRSPENQPGRGAAGPRPGQAPPKPFDLGAFHRIVDSCIGRTRRAFHQRDRMGRITAESQFNAVVSGPGYVSVVGPMQERAAFQQCMADEGSPVLSP